MLKLQSLRNLLAQCIPDLARTPENLIITGDNGQIVATGTQSLSFEYRYTAFVTVLDFAGHADALMVPVLAWCKVHQADLFASKEKSERAIRFNVEPLNATTCDIGIEIDLTERAIVKADPDHPTRVRISHPDEPGQVGLQRFDGKDIHQLEQWELWLRDEQLLARWEFKPPGYVERFGQ